MYLLFSLTRRDENVSGLALRQSKCMTFPPTVRAICLPNAENISNAPVSCPCLVTPTTRHTRAQCTPGSHTQWTMAGTPAQGLGGRKRRNDLWTYFTHNPAENKTECLVVGDRGTRCGYKLRGKNTTNLKRHLKAHHAAISAMVS